MILVYYDTVYIWFLVKGQYVHRIASKSWENQPKIVSQTVASAESTLLSLLLSAFFVSKRTCSTSDTFFL